MVGRYCDSVESQFSEFSDNESDLGAGCHSLQITNCCFLPNINRAATSVVSSDVAGGLYYHSLTSWVVRTGVSSKLIITEGRGPALLYPLMPFTIPLKAGNAAVDPANAYVREVHIPSRTEKTVS